MSMKAEQRTAKRLPSSRPVVYLHDKHNSYATMTDFSSNGIGFIADIESLDNDFIEVHFDIIANKEIYPFQFKAEVKHCTHLNHKCHIGVQFDITTQAYTQLYNQLASR
ncbi:MAG: PilZ domain-containing protein [Thiotrichales bacterium]|nr:PilZ domain-containing protein [Thiotrichales bacterium]